MILRKFGRKLLKMSNLKLTRKHIHYTTPTWQKILKLKKLIGKVNNRLLNEWQIIDFLVNRGLVEVEMNMEEFGDNIATQYSEYISKNYDRVMKGE
jgi:hypothetical protein